MITKIRRWFGLCVHRWYAGNNIMTGKGVVHLRLCEKCGKVKWAKGYRRD